MTCQSARPEVPSADSQAYRHYDVELPYHVSGFIVGIAISKFKELGVWNNFPRSLKDKVRAAKTSWAGLQITQMDLDSIPDDVWETIAAALGVKWRYATCQLDDRGPIAARGR